MTDDELREQAEAARLRAEIARVSAQLERTNLENIELDAELKNAIKSISVLINNCTSMGNEVYGIMSGLSEHTDTADISTKEVYQALNELTLQYFSFKNISTASKNMTQYNDEYFRRFSYYNELRRISLGYVIGLDTNIISSETARKKVEKAYLQNTEYWLAYSISAVMLWASDEREAAERALNKSLSINYFNSCLFFLLINLRFNRIEAAKKWYVNFLDRADVNNLGDEWQYLLQAYLFGAFGADEQFQKTVSDSFKNMLSQVEVTTVDFAKKFTKKAIDFSEMYVHKTSHEYTLLRRNCAQYEEMKELLSTAEKNTEIAKYYNSVAEQEITEDKELPQRIENVLYSLVNDYDEDEFNIVQKIKYNEAVINAKGDVESAQASYEAMYKDYNKKKDLGDLMLDWAFAPDTSQTDVSVKRFAISLMKEPIKKGFEQFPERYRERERGNYTFDIDECKIVCDENGYNESEKVLDKFYDKNKLKRIFKDRQVLICGGMCGVALILLLILFLYFSPVIMTIGILTGLAGSFLLWRRIVDLGKILKEKKRKSKLLLKQTLEELAQWRTAYKEADARNADLLNAIERF
ncbi:MAG: hypothetical protein HDT44_11335 [Ruminococcaceae bacterium]|nr:hypothetical protein [Oscillospiraceae bacterium]